MEAVESAPSCRPLESRRLHVHTPVAVNGAATETTSTHQAIFNDLSLRRPQTLHRHSCARLHRHTSPTRTPTAPAHHCSTTSTIYTSQVTQITSYQASRRLNIFSTPQDLHRQVHIQSSSNHAAARRHSSPFRLLHRHSSPASS